MYRPTADDMKPVETQKLSLTEAGAFDKKFHIYDGPKLVDRQRTTGWTSVCRQRAATGISRKAQIRAARQAEAGR